VPIVAVFQDPTFNRDKYDEAVRKLAGKDKLESPADWPVEGLLTHIAADGEDGFYVVDVWESQDAFDRFGQTLGPLLQEAGVEGGHDFYQVHTFVSA